VVADEALVDPGVLEGGGPVPGRLERPHQQERAVGVERVERGEPLRPPNGFRVVAARGRVGRQRLDRRERLLGSAHPLPLGPPLELGGVGHVDTVEERAPIERGRTLVVAGRDGLVELRDVAPDHVRIQPELRGRRRDRVRGQALPKDVEQLRERVARALRGAVRPEQHRNPVTAQPRRAGGRENREQCQPPALRGGAGEWSAVLLEAEPTERAQSEHHTG
jgi:hypothetical protein